MNAMTWYDHGTRSIWSQPWGRAIDGERKGIELFLLPSQVTTWANWKAEHPGTLLMSTSLSRIRFGGQRFSEDFVIGLVLGDQARAYGYPDVVAAGIINDMLGEFPVMVWADDANYHAYLRRVDDRTLTFVTDGERITDEQTGSEWDIRRGLAISGPLQGQVLQQVPSLTSYDWAWQDFLS